MTGKAGNMIGKAVFSKGCFLKRQTNNARTCNIYIHNICAGLTIFALLNTFSRQQITHIICFLFLLVSRGCL